MRRQLRPSSRRRSLAAACDPGSCALAVSCPIAVAARRRARSYLLSSLVGSSIHAMPRSAKLGAQTARAGAEQRPQDPRRARHKGRRRHACEAAAITCPLAPRARRMSTVSIWSSSVWPVSDEVSAFRGRRLGEQPVARLARRSREAASPASRRSSAASGARCRCAWHKRGDRVAPRRPPRRAGHGRSSRRPAASRGDSAVEIILEQEQQRQRIAAAGDGGHHRAGLSASSNCWKMASLSMLARAGAQHAARACSCLTRCFSASDDLG